MFKITHTASTPPWAQVINLDGVSGFWIDTNFGSPIFLRKEDHVIWLPKMLRGRKLQDVTPEELKAIPAEDSGKTHYKQWRQTFDADQEASKVHNGYAFSPTGVALIDRLKSLIEKYELDDTQNIGLHAKYSINPALFDKLMQTNNREDARRIGRLIAKKFAVVVHLLNSINPKLAQKLDQDFMFGYKKLQALFGFDVTTFKPNLDDPEATEPFMLKQMFQESAKQLLDEAKPLLTQNSACVKVLQGLKMLLKTITKFPTISQEAHHHIAVLYMDIMDGLVQLKKVAGNDPRLANLPQIADAVGRLPSLQAFHELVTSG